jgi:hypothetical protein
VKTIFALLCIYAMCCAYGFNRRVVFGEFSVVIITIWGRPDGATKPA